MQGRVSGMRFNEGGRDLVESERVVKRVAPIPHATKHKHFSAVYTPAACGSPYPTHPVTCVWPLNIRVRVRVR